MKRRHTTLVAGALAGAATAAWVAKRAHTAEKRHPPIGTFVEVGGVRLHYLERGVGPPVVLLHGNLVLLQDFLATGILDALAVRHRVIAFDRPGFGFSERPRNRIWTPEAEAALLHQAFARLQLDRPVVLGHSWATLVAVALGLQDPNAVRRLVLVSGYYFPSLRADVAFAAPAALPVLGDVMRYTTSPLLARLLLKRTVAKMFAPQPVPPGYLHALPRELLVRPSQIRAMAEEAAFMIPAAARLQERYASLDVPAVILAGARDGVVDPRGQSVRLHQVLARSELVVLPGAGHMLHHAASEQVAAAVEGGAATKLPAGGRGVDFKRWAGVT
jgi:pimeloyl-ACP methyl ester carboxylesterase